MEHNAAMAMQQCLRGIFSCSSSKIRGVTRYFASAMVIDRESDLSISDSTDVPRPDSVSQNLQPGSEANNDIGGYSTPRRW